MFACTITRRNSLSGASYFAEHKRPSGAFAAALDQAFVGVDFADPEVRSAYHAFTGCVDVYRQWPDASNAQSTSRDGTVVVELTNLARAA